MLDDGKDQMGEWLAAVPPEPVRDELVFEAIFERYGQIIHNYILRLVGDRDDAEDLAAETFIKAFRRLDSLSDQEKVLSWLYRIATNTCLDAIRRRKIVRWIDWDEFVLRFMPRLAASDDPERDALREEQAEMVRQVLDKLPEKQRVCLVLFEYEGRSYAEIAQVIGTTPGTVKTLLFRARERFRRHYKSMVGRP
jgi:RNA polymerase sigma-70 factor (ECF subfamily)